MLLFGSVALGTAAEGSDIDLCLVFDDLGDYSQRSSLKNRAQDAAAHATGRPVNVHVCDRPEWRALCECVSTFERHIASYAVVLRERPPRQVDWNKQILGPVTSVALAERVLDNSYFPLVRLSVELKVCTSGHAEHAQQVGATSSAAEETWDHWHLRCDRARVCVAAVEVIEVSLIAVNHSLPGPHLPKLALDVAGAVAAMPLRDAERAAVQAALSGVDPHDVALWRKTRWSNEDDPVSEPRVQEMATPHRTHSMAKAAYRVAEAAAGIVEQRLGQTPASERISPCRQARWSRGACRAIGCTAGRRALPSRP